MVKSSIRRFNSIKIATQEAQDQGYYTINSKTRISNKKSKIKRSNSIKVVRQEAKEQGYGILRTKTRQIHTKPVRLIELISFKLRKQNKRTKNQRIIRKTKAKLSISEPVQTNNQTLQNISQSIQLPQTAQNNISQQVVGQIQDNIIQNEEIKQNDSTNYRICLGWTTKCDVDASIMMYDSQMNLVDFISFRQLQSKDNACKHSGDDTQGKNAEGDNEIISINLSKLNKNIKSMWPVINVYSGFSSFKDVSGVYCRILDSDGNIISRVDLQINCWDNVSNGCIMAKMTVEDNKLAIQPKGLYTKNTTTCNVMENIIKEVEKNDFSNITLRETQFNV